jgi:hypothetical protein
MKRMMLLLIAGLISSVALAQVVTVSGKVLDQTTRSPRSGVRVNLLTLEGTWKFWTLPEQILVTSATTDETGGFVLRGDIPRYYVVEIEVEDCWAPYKKVFDIKKDGNQVGGLEITTWADSCQKAPWL